MLPVRVFGGLVCAVALVGLSMQHAGVASNAQRWSAWPHVEARSLGRAPGRVSVLRVEFELDGQRVVARDHGYTDSSIVWPAYGERVVVAYDPSEPRRVVSERCPRRSVLSSIVTLLAFCSIGLVLVLRPQLVVRRFGRRPSEDPR